jgi:hypothetical protein
LHFVGELENQLFKDVSLKLKRHNQKQQRHQKKPPHQSPTTHKSLHNNNMDEDAPTTITPSITTSQQEQLQINPIESDDELKITTPTMNDNSNEDVSETPELIEDTTQNNQMPSTRQKNEPKPLEPATENNQDDYSPTLTTEKVITTPRTVPEKSSSSSEEDEEKDVHEAKKPKCPSSTDMYKGTKNMVNGIMKQNKFSQRLMVIGRSMLKGGKSIGNCVSSVWNGVTHFFSFSKRSDENAENYSDVEPVFVEQEKVKRSEPELPTTSVVGDTNEEKGIWGQTTRMARGAKVMVVDAGEKVIDWFSAKSDQ